MRDKRYRRHHRKRMEAKAKEAFVVHSLADNDDHLELRAKVFADNLKKCGCEMCRNPRRTKLQNKNQLRTRQEVVADLNYKEQLQE